MHTDLIELVLGLLSELPLPEICTAHLEMCSPNAQQVQTPTTGMLHGEGDLLAERFEHCGVPVLIMLQLLLKFGLQQTKLRMLSQRTSRE